jgi:DNA-binding GntR family transcriptional regulator
LLTQTEAHAQADAPEPLQWETRNKNFHDALIAAHDSPWTKYMLSILYRHGERYRNINWRLTAAHAIERRVHEEHETIFQAAINRQEARAALALEAHVRMTHDIVKQQAYFG